MSFVKDFRAICVPLGVGAATHTLYLKEHTSSTQEKGKSKLLFVGNVDYGQQVLSHTELDTFLRDMFDGFGDIEAIAISEFSEISKSNRDQRSARFAHIQFGKSKSVKAALSALDSVYARVGLTVAQIHGVGERARPKSGVELTAKFPLFDLVDTAQLREEINEELKEFDEEEEARRREVQRRMREPDEDGFITAGPRNKRKAGVQGSSSSAESTSGHGHGRRSGAGARSRGAKKEKPKELTNFYRFQVKEQKKNELSALRAKFDEDRAKIAALKKQRLSFNPMS